ncbi:element excision factor XisI family protein [Calothrix sp. PCC 6303]|uniref:element excision factor XisI family protein n=1 Tax=Calothrix sp. PCC 6303 TaxID=1170562 RepID=UPI0002A01AEB|nr:element excision factor XisI family protein [Calothrix sp. PCC 6303]AFZ00280.1 XisI protein [Calothrix sp. PCC 6303]
MDRINEYRQIVRDFLEDFIKNDANAQLIFDLERDRYLIVHNEWQDDYRIYGCAMQLDIIEGQIWIQHNSTEIYIERELIQRGVFPKDIIFGFRSPSIRKLLAAGGNN